MTDDKQPPAGGMAAERLRALTDGVVAISLTLLALDLKPTIEATASSRDLAHYLSRHGGQYLAFVIAFALIARYWVVHHTVLADVRWATRSATSTNILFLFAITLVPLTTFIEGAHTSSLGLTLFAANLFLVTVALGVLRALVQRADLHAGVESPGDRARRRAAFVSSASVPALVAAFAWVIGGQATYLFLLFAGSDLPVWLAGRHATAAADRRENEQRENEQRENEQTQNPK